MPTPFTSFVDANWSHDWDYAVISSFGDPDDGEPHGIVVTIKADSGAEAEYRALAYAVNNFDDDFRGVVAESTGPTPGDPGRFAVRMTWKAHR